MAGKVTWAVDKITCVAEYYIHHHTSTYPLTLYDGDHIVVHKHHSLKIGQGHAVTE